MDRGQTTIPDAGSAVSGAMLPPAGMRENCNAISGKWHALEAAAEVVASLAEEAVPAEAGAFFENLDGADDWRQSLARQNIDDLSAIMEAGLSALLVVHGQGGDARAAAQSLWQEYQMAREALFHLVAGIPEAA